LKSIIDDALVGASFGTAAVTITVTPDEKATDADDCRAIACSDAEF
jgi:hypothetical protein